MTTGRPPVADVDQDLPEHVRVCIYACVLKVKVFIPLQLGKAREEPCQQTFCR